MTIPPSWAIAPLESLATIQNGYAFDANLFSEADGFPLIRIRDIARGYTNTRYKGEVLEQFIVRRGDLLIGMDGNFECHEWTGPDGLLNQRVCRIVPKLSLPKSYLRNYLNIVLPKIQAKTIKLTVAHLSSKQIARIEIPLPPLREASRIDTKTNSCFSRIDAIEASIGDTFVKILQRFALSFLKSQRHRTDEYQKIAELYSERNERLGNLEGKDARSVGVSNELGVVDLRSEKLKDMSKYKWVRQGDIFYNPMRINIGSIAIYEDEKPAITSPDYVVVKPNGYASTQLLFQFLKSADGASELKKRTKGAVRERVYFASLGDISIPRIAEKSHHLADTSIKALRQEGLVVEAVLKRLVELRNTVLASAFSGRLVEQIESESSGHELLVRIGSAIEPDSENITKKVRSRKAKS